MRVREWWAPVALALVVVGPITRWGPHRAGVRRPELEPPRVREHRLWLRLLVPDSLIVDGQFVVPASDGRGALDSLRVDVLAGILPAPSQTWRPPLPTGTVTYQLRGQFPASSGTSTYDVQAIAYTFRRGLATPAASNLVPITVADVAPPGVGGHRITAVKVP